MAGASVSYTLAESNGRKFTIRGTGNDIGAARAEASAKLGFTVGTAVKASETVEVAAVAGGSTGSYSDADLILRRGEKTVSVHLENIANSFALVVDTVATGLLDLTKFAAFAGAYADGDGNTGYVAYDGHFGK